MKGVTADGLLVS